MPSGAGTVYVGLFANNSGIIKNLAVSGSINVGLTYGFDYGFDIGAIAGRNDGTIEFCSNYAEINAASNYNTIDTGGISGYSNGIISECYNNGTITAEISFYNNYCYASGIAAGGKENKIINCYNTGSVSAKNTYYNNTTNSYSAGICSSYENMGQISNCYNVGIAKNAIAL